MAKIPLVELEKKIKEFEKRVGEHEQKLNDLKNKLSVEELLIKEREVRRDKLKQEVEEQSKFLKEKLQNLKAMKDDFNSRDKTKLEIEKDPEKIRVLGLQEKERADVLEKEILELKERLVKKDKKKNDGKPNFFSRLNFWSKRKNDSELVSHVKESMNELKLSNPKKEIANVVKKSSDKPSEKVKFVKKTKKLVKKVPKKKLKK